MAHEAPCRKKRIVFGLGMETELRSVFGPDRNYLEKQAAAALQNRDRMRIIVRGQIQCVFFFFDEFDILRRSDRCMHDYENPFEIERALHDRPAARTDRPAAQTDRPAAQTDRPAARTEMNQS